MPLHLVKLCVGADSVESLQTWIRSRLAEKNRAGEKPEHFHVTRMIPRRASELLDSGSLFWVIRGKIQARQRLVAIEPFRDGEGVRRCRLVLDPNPVLTEWQPRRAFQGWRYLADKDAPADIMTNSAATAPMPPQLKQDLAELGLL